MDGKKKATLKAVGKAASRARLDKNHHRMMRGLYFVAKRMTPDQITKARQLIREWKARSTKRA